MRDKIDRDLLAGLGSITEIAERYKLSKSVVGRHKNNHVAQALAKAEVTAEAARDEDYNVKKLIGQIHTLAGHALTVMKRCEEKGDDRTALQALRETRECFNSILKVALAIEDLKRRPLIESGKEDFSNVDMNKLTEDELRQVADGNYNPLRRIASADGHRPVIFVPEESDD